MNKKFIGRFAMLGGIIFTIGILWINSAKLPEIFTAFGALMIFIAFCAACGEALYD